MKKILIAVLALSVFALPSIAEARKGSRKAAAKRPAVTAPKQTPAPAATAAAPQQQKAAGGGMAGNIMSTAAGVAIGSVVGNALTKDASAEEAVPAEDATAPADATTAQPEAIEPAAE